MCGILADHVDDLNKWLQRSPEGDVSHELIWAMILDCPNNETIYRATTKCEYNTVQRNAP